MDQALKFEDEVAVSKFTLFFECSEDTMLKRLLKRGETSGRIDDNIESIKKRFNTFQVTSMPVVDFYEKKGKIIRIDASSTPDEVYSQVKKELTVWAPSSLPSRKLKMLIWSRINSRLRRPSYSLMTTDVLGLL
jgi:thymidylate kinase